MGIGERLREARMRQKIDIGDVEAATKIRAKYLRALENEEFGLLPGNTFVKTFLRTYAEHLGLDPVLLLEEYRAEYEPRTESELQQYSVAARQRATREPRHRPRAAAGPPGPGTALIVVVGVVLVIFAILGLTGGDEEPENDAATQEQKERPRGKERARGKQPEAREPRRVTSLRVRVSPQVATYLCVDRGPDTQTVYEETTTEPVDFRGRRVRINAGNSSVRLSVNGRRVRVPSGPDAIGYDFRLREGEVVTDTIELGERPCA